SRCARARRWPTCAGACWAARWPSRSWARSPRTGGAGWAARWCSQPSRAARPEARCWRSRSRMRRRALSTRGWGFAGRERGARALLGGAARKPRPRQHSLRALVALAEPVGGVDALAEQAARAARVAGLRGEQSRLAQRMGEVVLEAAPQLERAARDRSGVVV